jgi:hypothetical protein
VGEEARGRKEPFRGERADLQAERDHEEARKKVGEAQEALRLFNEKYGPDVEYWADRLIRHYNDEKTNHDTPAKQAEQRLENLKKVEAMSYPSLPFLISVRTSDKCIEDACRNVLSGGGHLNRPSCV